MGDRKSIKGRDVHAWNPEYGWQILRRCPGYIKAVDQYLAEAKAAEDEVSQRVYWKIVGRKRAKAVGRRKSAKAQKVKPFNVYDALLVAKAKADFRKTLEAAAKGTNLFGGKFITETPHFRKFQKKYGDIISFPLHYSYRDINIFALAAAWNLYPIVAANMTTDANGLLTYTATINPQFSNAAIRQAVDQSLESWLVDAREEYEPNRFLMGRKNWSEFERQLSAYDLNVRDGLGYQKIGDHLWKAMEPRARKKSAENAVKQIRNVLIPFFDR